MTITKQGAWMFLGLVIFWLGQHHALAQGLCDKNNWPAGAVEGDFKIEGDISVGCSPLTVKLKNLSAGTDIRYDFYYDGKAANALDKVGNKDSVNALFASTNIQVYRILQYGKKNGQDMFTCKTISVRPNTKPAFSYSQCGPNVEIAIPKAKENFYEYYELTWNNNLSTKLRIDSSQLSFTIARNVSYPVVLKVEGFPNGLTGCNSINTQTALALNPTNFPNGYILPYDPNIDEVNMPTRKNIIMKFRGSENPNGYNLNIRENIANSTYALLKTGITPGQLNITLPDTNKSYCFFLNRSFCGGEYTSEICTIPLNDPQINDDNIQLSWPTYPVIINNRPFLINVNTLEKEIIVEKRTLNNIDEVKIGANDTKYTENIQDCLNNVQFRVKLIAKGLLAAFQYRSTIYSNWVDIKPNSIIPNAITDVVASVDDNNMVEITFNDNSVWNIPRNRYLLVDSLNQALDSATNNSLPFKVIREDNQCFKINFRDNCGSISEFSPLVCPISLKTSDNDELNWSPKSPFGLGNLTTYEILEIDENTNIEKIIKSLNPSIKKSKTDLKDFEVEAKYRIKGISSGGKESFSNTVKIPIEALFFVPDVFTPNGDPENGTLQIKGRFGRVQDYKLQIFDRWGTPLLEIDDFKENWDGTHQQRALPVGIYLYKLSIGLTGNENFIKQGKFELLR